MPSTKSKTTLGHSWEFEAIGTRWEIASSSSITPGQQKQIQSIIDQFDSVYSRFRSDSTIARMAHEAGEYVLPHSPSLFEFYDQLYTLTSGAVNPLVGGVLEDLGYDANYSFKQKSVIRDAPEYTKVLQRSGEHVTISEPVSIDVGAAGKGFLVDLLFELLESKGHQQFTVDGSGDVRVSATYVERIGLEHPNDPRLVIGVAELKGRALCASATNKRSWPGAHHIISPHTKKPVDSISATWVIADTALEADGLATALFFVEPQVLQARYNYGYVRLHSNGGVEYSSYFEGRLF